MLLEVTVAGSYPLCWLPRRRRRPPPSTLTAPAVSWTLIPDEHLRFLGSCLDYSRNQEHIFVHASYVSDLPMDEQQHRDPAVGVGAGNWFPVPTISGKTVIAGHTSQKNGEILDLGHVKVIDTYCYGGGWLTALDVQTEEVWQADREGNMRRL